MSLAAVGMHQPYRITAPACIQCHNSPGPDVYTIPINGEYGVYGEPQSQRSIRMSQANREKNEQIGGLAGLGAEHRPRYYREL